MSVNTRKALAYLHLAIVENKFDDLEKRAIDKAVQILTNKTNGS